MAFVGYLSKFSLPELFQFIQEGYKSGLLTIRTLNADKTVTDKTSYIWLQQGRIVAAAETNENQGLLTLITQRGWMSQDKASKVFQMSPANMAMGLCLKSQGLLQAEQLTLLFRAQITSQVCPLFQLRDGQFELTPQTSLPYAEMTGISIPATEATITGLRMLRDWSALQNKLPDLTSGLTKKIFAKSEVRLEYSESQVLEYATGKMSLRDIARTIELSNEKVAQIAFRLIVTNLVEECLITTAPHKEETSPFADLNSTNAFGQKRIPQTQPTPLTTKASSQLSNNNSHSLSGTSKLLEPALDSSPKAAVSKSFLHNLVGFLQSKAAS
ncbi:unknown protein [Calothrix sp. PCC 7716]|nr:unknown protein [Calothrix sp. PCC 7716]